MTGPVTGDAAGATVHRPGLQAIILAIGLTLVLGSATLADSPGAPQAPRAFPNRLRSPQFPTLTLAAATDSEKIDPAVVPAQCEAHDLGREKGDRSNLCAAPYGPFRQIGPVPLSLTDLRPIVPSDQGPDDGRHTIDLGAALRLAGANNLHIQIARQKVSEAVFRSEAADAAWLPSVRAGAGYNRHEGRIQDTRGGVILVERDSLYLGGGAGVGSDSLNGAAGGPARLSVNLSLAEAIFERLRARQLVVAEDAVADATFNDTLLAVALAFVSLSESHGRLLAAQRDVEDAEQVAKTTEDFYAQQMVPRSDVARAKAELGLRRRRHIEAQEDQAMHSATLVRLLRLDPEVRLEPDPPQPVPIELVESDVPLERLLAQGLTNRPELAHHQAMVEATLVKLREQRWRPWLPHLVAGASGGMMGGGPIGDFEPPGGRIDLDLAAVWELQGLGVVQRARVREYSSRHHRSVLEAEALRDAVAEQVVRSHRLLEQRRRRLEVVRETVDQAQESLRLNLDRIRGGEGLPIEVVQATSTLAAAREAAVRAIADHNRAQAELLRAIGRPIVDPGEAGHALQGTAPHKP